MFTFRVTNGCLSACDPQRIKKKKDEYGRSSQGLLSEVFLSAASGGSAAYAA